MFGTFSGVLGQDCYHHEQGSSIIYPVHIVVLIVMAELQRHLIASSHSVVGFLPIRFECVLNDVGKTEQPEECDSLSVKKASEMVILEDVILPATISK